MGQMTAAGGEFLPPQRSVAPVKNPGAVGGCVGDAVQKRFCPQ